MNMELNKNEYSIEFRDYQKNSWETFLEKGMIGIFAPDGWGKTLVGVGFMERMKGNFTVVARSILTLAIWKHYITEKLGSDFLNRVTMHLYTDSKEETHRDKPCICVFFDEIDLCPLKKYEEWFHYPKKYSVALGRNLERADGDEVHVLSLSGYPVGGTLTNVAIDLYYQKEVRIALFKKLEYPMADLSNQIEKEKYEKEKLSKKLEVVKRLLEDRCSTLILCEDAALGKEVAKKIQVSFVESFDSDDNVSKKIAQAITKKSCCVTTWDSVKEGSFCFSRVDRIIDFEFESFLEGVPEYFGEGKEILLPFFDSEERFVSYYPEHVVIMEDRVDKKEYISEIIEKYLTGYRTVVIPEF